MWKKKGMFSTILSNLFKNSYHYFKNISVVISWFFVEPTCDEQDSSHKGASLYVCASVLICPDHNLCIYGWILKYFGTIVLLNV